MKLKFAKRLAITLLVAIAVVTCVAATACDSVINCSNICPICMGCKSSVCFKHTFKCGGHVGDGEICVDLCETCGNCKDETCLQHDDKCQCDDTDVKECTALCPTCGLCRNADCKQHSQKCAGHGNSQGAGVVDFYAINDFHGEVGLFSKFAGYLNDKKDGNTVLINSGDMFQGSMQSNSNSGKLLASCIDEVGFDSLTIGNHEFDWGLDKLIDLKNSSETPFLGANIYKWNANDKTWGDFADDVAQKYVVKQLDNGLRVGIIGVIGKRQITSISSTMVQSIGFKDPAEVVPSLAQELREKQNCDVVVLSAHADEGDFLSGASFDVTNYVDAVFCAHSHQEEITVKNGVVFIQGASNGRYVSNVRLKVDGGNVSVDSYKNEPYSSGWKVNQVVQSMIDNSNDKIKVEAEQQLARLDGELNYNYGVSRLVCQAIVNYCNKTGVDVDYAMCNQGRSALYGGVITYSDLYESLPFDNAVYVARVSGADFLNETKYASFWRNTESPIEADKYYTVAIIDYLLTHQNMSRNYDYFPSATKGEGSFGEPLKKEGVDNYNYRLIVKDFLLEQKNIASANYNEENVFTDKDYLYSTISLDPSQLVTPAVPQTEHDGTESDPYSVKDAVALLKTGAQYSGAYVEGVYMSGTEISYNEQYDSYSFYLWDVENNNAISIYCYGIQLSAETIQKIKSASSPVKIKICTTLKLYNGISEAFLGSEVTQSAQQNGNVASNNADFAKIEAISLKFSVKYPVTGAICNFIPQYPYSYSFADERFA